ncbi:MAG: dehydratase [Rhizobiales bacterium]|nr:dehydratase [Hyphomicrobiales bacterium]
MDVPTFDRISVGDTIGPMRLPPVDRLTLALYCGASNDHNPIHVDPDAARRAGLEDVIAHGMLSMAYVGRLITSWVPQERVRSFKCRFVGMMKLGEEPELTGTVREKHASGDEKLVLLALSLSTRGGGEKVRAEALIELGDSSKK